MAIQWLTTAPNPRVPAYGFDAGQRGWKLHAVEAEDSAKFSEVADKRSLCGLLPSHGWGLDLFIEDKCSRCLKAIERDKTAVKNVVNRRRTGRGLLTQEQARIASDIRKGRSE